MMKLTRSKTARRDEINGNSSNNINSNSKRDEVPARPVPPYHLWLREEGLPVIRSVHPGANPATIAKLAGEAWAQLDPIIRNRFITRHKEAHSSWLNAKSSLKQKQ